MIISNAQLIHDYFLDTVQEVGQLWKWSTFEGGVLQYSNFLGLDIYKGYGITLDRVATCLKIKSSTFVTEKIYVME